MRKKIIVLLFTAAACLLGAGRALACSCIGPVPPCHEYGRASAVFVGTVTGLKTNKREEGSYDFSPRVFRFSVEQAFLGVAGHEVEVATGTGGGDCGYNFRRGEKYLVYAYHSAGSGRLTTGICSRTRPYLAAAEDLEFLSGLGSMPAGVQIAGRVLRERRRDADASPEYDGVPSSTLSVSGEGQKREVVTDAQGRYRLTGLRPGTYKVELRPPAGVTSHQPSQEVKIGDRGCAEANFYLVSDGRVGGRVTDAQGVFSLRAFAGFDYLVGAYINLEGAGQMHAEWVEVPPGGEAAEVVLRVTEPDGNCARCAARTLRRPRRLSPGSP
ncbi:MAG: carboxypeptidase regulatory-like domain-containing protein [Acidobacteriota bacterium]|nr:carboxypeptidase regulatory-like domain-containing protein [Acidobacteriota bacterium]